MKNDDENLTVEEQNDKNLSQNPNLSWLDATNWGEENVVSFTDNEGKVEQDT